MSRVTQLGARAPTPRARAAALVRVDRVLAYRAAIATVLITLAAVSVWNVFEYPSASGYDTEQHQRYADIIVEDLHLPQSGEGAVTYKPPGFFAVAGAADLVGKKLGLEDRYKVARLLNAAFLVAAAAFVFALARLLWPARRALHVSAVAFFALVPVTVKTAAMYHPGTLALLLSTLALYVAAVIFARRWYRVWPAVLLALVLLLGLLVMPHVGWTYAAIVAAFVGAALVRAAPRRRVLASLAAILGVSALAVAPWYVRQAVVYGDPVLGHRQGSAIPFFERRPREFYTGFGYPEVFTRPYRPSFTNQLVPMTYTELWGDWFGVFAWGEHTSPAEEPEVRAELSQQGGLGLVPTLLAVGGWVALLATSVTRRWLRASPARLALALLPLFGLAGFLYYAIGFPTVDGDTIKATYMLTTAPAWALAFGLATDRALRVRSLRVPLAVFLVGAALLNLRFVVFGSPLGGLL